MRPRGAIVVLTAAGLGLGGCGGAALQTAQPPADFASARATVIFNCVGKGAAQPRSLMLACGDGGQFLTQVRWTRWGRATARGSGEFVVNLCEPDCAAGHTARRHAALTARGLSLTGTSAAYTQLSIAAAPSGPIKRSERFSLTVNGPVPQEGG